MNTISLYVNTGNTIKKYYVKSANLIMSHDSETEKTILENVSDEFDGICDSEGREHFLIQDITGGLVYLKYDKGVWKKYNIFVNKEKKQKISSVYLAESFGTLCGFYAMEHSGSVMLVRHIFSEDNLYGVPVVVDLLDTKRDFCLCTNKNGNICLFYRSSKGQRMMTELDRDFSTISSGNFMADKNIFSMCAINNGFNTFIAYTEPRKNVLSLIFNSLDENDNEKIITFAVSKNCDISLFAKNESITLRWTENDTVMESVSTNGGESFSKPRIIARSKNFDRMREKGIKPGIYFDKILYDASFRLEGTAGNHNKKISEPNNSERNNKMSVNNYLARSYSTENLQITAMLGEIVSEVEKMGKNLEDMCSFLDKLISFKEEASITPFKVSEKDEDLEFTITNSEIGETNDENIKKFENMSIDDVLPGKTFESSPNGGEVNE